jgi:putative transposase
MHHQLYPPDLTCHQWDCINDLIPPANAGGRPRTLDLRHVINAILYVVVGGIPWRMPPKDYPAWKSVYHSFRQWRDDGTWQHIHDTLRAAVRRKAGRHTQPTAGCLDRQSVKTSQVPGVRGYDQGKHSNGRTRHIVVDTMGLLLTVVVTSAALSDPAGARLVRKRLGGAGQKLRRIWVDGAYRGTLLDWVADQWWFLLAPVLRAADQQGFQVLPRRWVVERSFAWMARFRRLARDYERLPETLAGLHCLAFAMLVLKRFITFMVEST